MTTDSCVRDDIFVKAEGYMFYKILALFAALFIGLGALIPLTTNNTEANTLNSNNYKKKRKTYKKYSKQWWRAYRNRVRKRNALEARRRILRLRRIRLANAGKISPQSYEHEISTSAPLVQNNDLFVLAEGKIIKVLDGDTFEIESRDGKVYRVRMLGIDAPEINQEYGGKSQDNLKSLILGKTATAILRKKDSAGSFIGTLYCGGEDVNLLQIKNGMAQYFQQNGYEPLGNDRLLYARAERRARNERKGFWAKQKPENAVALKK